MTVDFELLATPPEDPAADVLEMARQFPDRITDGDFGKVRSVAIVIANGTGNMHVLSRGSGRGSIVETAGMFALGMAELHSIALDPSGRSSR